MKWKKRKLLYVANSKNDWAVSHAMVPTPEIINDELIRCYLTFCDNKGIGRIGYINIDINDFSDITDVSETPLVDIGQPGSFDDNGVMATSLVNLPGGEKYLYYVGFELCHNIRYRLLAGLAVSNDNGKTFTKVSKTPVLERSNNELYFRGGPYVLYDENKFKMWYVAGSSWETIDNKEMPVYTINYIESDDGINWPDHGKTCIDMTQDDEHGFGRPWVIKENNTYKMFYSIRKKHIGYRLGYAESEDGITWVRKDHEVGIDVSPEGWDSDIICYSSVIKINNKKFMFYNGNDFGRTGMGFAEMIHE